MSPSLVRHAPASRLALISHQLVDDYALAMTLDRGVTNRSHVCVVDQEEHYDGLQPRDQRRLRMGRRRINRPELSPHSGLPPSSRGR